MQIESRTAGTPYRRRLFSFSLAFFAATLTASCSRPEGTPVQPETGTTPRSERPSSAAHLQTATPSLDPFAGGIVAAQQLPKVPFADLYPALLARAEAGDSEAKRQLFLVLNECRTNVQLHEPSYGTDTIVDPELLRSTGMTREQFLADQQRRSLLSTDRTLEECAALPAGAIGDAAKWLAEAAEGGDAYAQLTYFNYADLIVGPPKEQLRSPDRVEEFNANSMRYLQGLADQRIPEAFDSLSSAYELGIITPKDVVRAYAYKKAAGDIAPTPGNERALQIMAKGMTHEQISKAKQLAPQLAQRSVK
ncbi:TPA: sel1 repeat family protein [Stenotrophomonas maltophilia]|nr:sel1 repeat family protein [Stenotrophomonas maltophilia]